MLRVEVIIILIGLRASGKTTIGRLAAHLLHRTFIDLDDTTAALCGCAGPGEVITRLGLETFRREEVVALRQVTHSPVPGGLVLALGGGTPTATGAADHLRELSTLGLAKVIYLRASEATMRHRLRGDQAASRPSLTGRPVIDEVGELLRIRDPLYRSLAHHVIDVDESPPEMLAERIAKLAQNA